MQFVSFREVKKIESSSGERLRQTRTEYSMMMMTTNQR